MPICGVQLPSMDGAGKNVTQALARVIGGASRVYTNCP
jgi:hypothetical protein